MLRRTALTALLLLSADAATTTLAPLGAPALTQAATAADFTGKIKRIRIKKTRVGSGFKVVARTTGDTSDSIDSVETRISTGDGAEETVMTAATNSRLVATGGEGSGIDPDGTVTVMLSNDENDDFDWEEGETYSAEERMRLEMTLSSGSGEIIGEAGRKVRARLTSDGALRIIVSNEDRSWDPDTVASIAYTTDGETITRVGIDEVRQRWTANLETDLSAADAVTVQTTLYDAEGVVLDSQIETVALSEEVDPGIGNVSAKETSKGDAKLVTWTTTSGDVGSLEVALTDPETGEAVLYTVDDDPVLTERTYLSPALEFDDDPTGSVYLCLIDLIDASGDPVGEQYEVELTMPSLEEGEESALSVVSFADGTGNVSFLNIGDAYYVVGALWHEDVALAESFNLIFEEPFEGPPPLETEVNAELISQRDKWIQKGDGALPDAYDVSVTLTTAEGEVLEELSASSSGTGAVYRDGNGIVGPRVSVGPKEVLLNIGF